MHEGHRKRMIDRVKKCGLESLQPHEMLEVLLFYIIPRKNTNEIAHLLLDKFGTFANVLDARPEELLKVEGVGPRTVSFLKMIPEFYRAYEKSRMYEVPAFDSISVASDFGRSLFRGETKELAYVVLLDNKMCKIDCAKIATGSTSRVDIDLKELYSLVLNKQAAAVILYHNHPGGLAIPSRNDIEVTTQIEMKLADIGIAMVEHFIVEGNSCCPLMRNMKSFSRIYIPNNNISETVIEYFYDK